MRRLVVATMLVALLATVLAPDAKADADSATRAATSRTAAPSSCTDRSQPSLGGDVHLKTTGDGVVADEFLKVLLP
jgi:hypothetical protein